ncbi:MAG: hypothetical protein NZ482_06430, partial [Gloeomargarita sp. SKYG98]|nr:hypothetical protein [Gloeomargarita sp. SKYG98]
RPEQACHPRHQPRQDGTFDATGLASTAYWLALVRNASKSAMRLSWLTGSGRRRLAVPLGACWWKAAHTS